MHTKSRKVGLERAPCPSLAPCYLQNPNNLSRKQRTDTVVVGKEDFPELLKCILLSQATASLTVVVEKLRTKITPSHTHRDRRTTTYKKQEPASNSKPPARLKSQQTAIHLSLRNLPSYCRQPHLTPPHVRV